MADTLKITRGPSEMDIMMSYFRGEIVEFEFDTPLPQERRKVRIRSMSGGSERTRSYTHSLINRYGGCSTPSCLLEAISVEPVTSRHAFYIVYELQSRHGLARVVKADTPPEDKLRVCWGDLIYGNSDWRRQSLVVEPWESDDPTVYKHPIG